MIRLSTEMKELRTSHGRDSAVVFKFNISLLVFIVSIIVPLFWYIGQTINVYRYAWLGALFELLSLPMLAALFILPVFSFVLLIKNKFRPRSLYLYSFIISLVSMLLIVTSK